MHQLIFCKHIQTQMYNMQTSPIMANLKAVSKRIRQSQLKLFSNTLKRICNVFFTWDILRGTKYFLFFPNSIWIPRNWVLWNISEYVKKIQNLHLIISYFIHIPKHNNTQQILFLFLGLYLFRNKSWATFLNKKKKKKKCYGQPSKQAFRFFAMKNQNFFQNL